MPDVTFDKKGAQSKYLYEDGPLKLTAKTIHVFGRSYPSHRIEKIGVRREPLFIALGLAVPCVLFALGFWSYLYWYEIILLLGLAALLISMTFSVGVLHIQAGHGYSPSAIWKHDRLVKFQEAIVEHVLEAHDR